MPRSRPSDAEYADMPDDDITAEFPIPDTVHPSDGTLDEEAGALAFTRLRQVEGSEELHFEKGTSEAVGVFGGGEGDLWGEANGTRFAGKTVKNNGGLKIDPSKPDSKIYRPNEDGLVVIQNGERMVTALFDGVGKRNGLEGGKLASQAFSKAVMEGLSLRDAMEKAHLALCQKNLGKKENDHYVTVMVAGEMLGDQCDIVWCGDAQAELLGPDGSLLYSTTPHNKGVAEFGTDRREYWVNAKARGIATSALGHEAYRASSMGRRVLASGSRLILRTDGLSDNCSSFETARIASGLKKPGSVLTELFNHQADLSQEGRHALRDIGEDGEEFRVLIRPKGDNASAAVMDYMGRELGFLERRLETVLDSIRISVREALGGL